MLTVAKNLYDHLEPMATRAWKHIAMEKWCLIPFSPRIQPQW
jgi:hypothetical protein